MNTLNDNLSSVQGKKVIVRCNFDVPLENGEVVDTTRLEDATETIKALLSHASQVILIAHADRPEGQYKEEVSLKHTVPTLEDLLSEKITFIEHQADFSKTLIPEITPLVMLDNLRFWAEEEANDPDFSQWLASLADIYINEAFANCHREHASITGITKHIPSYAGLHLQKEIDTLLKVKNHPEKPLIVVLGGAKLETKEPMVEAFKDTADHILVGGKIAVDLKEKHAKVPDNVHVAELTPDTKDITQAAAERFANYITAAETIIWNGTMGVFEEDEHQQGTRIVGTAIHSSPAFTVVGGGDTETALTQLDIEENIDHISTGGGAMLTLLSTGSLVGIEALS